MFFCSSRRRHTRCLSDWSSDVCSSDLVLIYADRMCGLHAALSTAYEYLQQHTTNPFVPGLTRVAEQLAPRVEARRVFARQIGRASCRERVGWPVASRRAREWARRGSAR